MRAGDRANRDKRKRGAAGRRGGLLLAALCGLATAVGVGPAYAGSATLTLSTSILHFPSADPDTSPVINATENPLGVLVRVTGNPWGQVQLTMLAAGDLVSGGDTVPITAVHWTAAGNGFYSGTLSKDSPQLAAYWAGNVYEQGTQSFRLDNSWSYATGNYSQTVVYTLVSY